MNFINPYISIIERELQSLSLPEKPETLYDPQRYILASSGKRIRPVLTLMACGLCGEKIENALPAAIALELVHNFTLIHDDIMDQAEFRRGKPPVHIKWNEATAILSGDSMFVQAFQQLQRLPKKIDYKKANKIFIDGINRVCEGQALDMEFSEREFVTSEEYLRMIGGKTAALISVSLMLGGVAANVSDQKIKLLESLGESLGLAFQIQDDLLDVIGDPEKFGKKQGGDISEGKKTFLMIRTLESSNSNEREWLSERLRNRPIQSEVVQNVLNLYKKYGVIESAETLLNDYYKKAKNTLDQFDDSNYKRDLQHLINYLQERDA